MWQTLTDNAGGCPLLRPHEYDRSVTSLVWYGGHAADQRLSTRPDRYIEALGLLNKRLIPDSTDYERVTLPESNMERRWRTANSSNRHVFAALGLWGSVPRQSEST